MLCLSILYLLGPRRNPNEIPKIMPKVLFLFNVNVKYRQSKRILNSPSTVHDRFIGFISLRLAVVPITLHILVSSATSLLKIDVALP